MVSDKPIGVFDSGVGGLTVLRKLVEALPGENYLYFGDTARVPYGEKTKEQLIQFVTEILNWYKYKDAKAVLMACNTSSAVVLDFVKDKYDFPIYGLIEPTAKHVAGLSEKNIGVIATSATIKSKAYSTNILKLNTDKNVFEIGCPGLVEIVESGSLDLPESKELVSKYVTQLLENNVEKIILGCTHYPFLTELINQVTNRPDMLIDPADYLVKAVEIELEKLGILSNSHCGSRKYFVSANAAKFAQVGHKFYSDCTEVEEINLDLLKI
ncbi:MAG: glutamate racemase [Candidatus Melainabacteria bacterium RIFOXYA12_FULL_32_12]|nr:MAG: glutamate racemase [Candidatus Melainabacteria bacterium RIFOXYA2_FULL_32_9]OGI26866.1 MAG: glutamate racemase [Candidatus Melainabacteria bacterium RIFOXYA12_FULL_32_12]